jgi:hypothetical protein
VPASVQEIARELPSKRSTKRLRDIGDAWKLLEEQPAVRHDGPRATCSAGRRGTACARRGRGAVGAVARHAIRRACSGAAARSGSGQDVSIVLADAPTMSSVVNLTRWNTPGVCGQPSPAGRSRLLTRRLDPTDAIELAGTEAP